MATGVVKWYNPEKGFGFIAPVGGGKDVFLHVSAVESAGHGDPYEGDRMSYDVDKGAGRTRIGDQSAQGRRLIFTLGFRMPVPYRIRAGRHRPSLCLKLGVSATARRNDA